MALLVEPTPFTHVSGYSNRFKEMLRFLKQGGDDAEATAEGESPEAVQALLEAIQPDAEALFGNSNLTLSDIYEFSWDVLKLTMVVVNSLLAYQLVNLFADVSWTISIVTFAVVCAMLLGLLEIAAAMADPFGGS